MWVPLSICQQFSGTVLFYQQTGSKESGFFRMSSGDLLQTRPRVMLFSVNQDALPLNIEDGSPKERNLLPDE
jgi:hypothetical protein